MYFSIVENSEKRSLNLFLINKKRPITKILCSIIKNQALFKYNLRFGLITFVLLIMSLDKSKYDKIILGIDPGTNIMGYGLLGVIGKKTELISIGIIKLQQFDNHALKLKHIFDRVSSILVQYLPDEVALEAPFFGQNVQSMLKLGRAQGVAIAAALAKDLPVFEYSPRKIKQSVTGKGSATKEQVAGMLQQIFDFKEMPKNLDATDALGAAFCHFNQFAPTGFGVNKSKNSWSSFVKENPDKLK